MKIKNGQIRNDIKVKLMSKTKNRPTKSSVNGFQCKFCLRESFQSDTALKKHIRDKHMKEMPFTCTFCNKTCFDENALKRHQEIYHITIDLKIKTIRFFAKSIRHFVFHNTFSMTSYFIDSVKP